MMSRALYRRIALTAATSALIGMGGLTGCATRRSRPRPRSTGSSATTPPSPSEIRSGAVTPGPQPGSGPTQPIDPGPTALPGSAITGG